jgi:hypothetical protein
MIIATNKIKESLNIHIVSKRQITHPTVIIRQAEINSPLLVSGELDNIHLGARLSVDEKEMLDVSDKVCSLYANSAESI